MLDDRVRCESRDGVVVITLDRVDKRNAVNGPMAEALREHWNEFEHGPDRVAILTSSSDEVFSAGADVSDLEPGQLENLPIMRAIPGVGVSVSKPVVTAVGGWCVGLGLGFTLFSDLCVAAENTSLWYREPHLGFASGMFIGLAARIPTKVAAEFLMMAEPMSAQRAYEVGMVNRVVPTGRQLEVAMEYAHKLAALPPRALALTKAHIQRTVAKSPAELSIAVRLEQDHVQSSGDAARGIAAFVEDREAPAFGGAGVS